MEQLIEMISVATVGVLSLVQIAPIPINPWSALARTIGNALTRDLAQKIDEVRKENATLSETLKNHIESSEEIEIKHCRQRILRFNDELMQGKRHTKEHFDEVLSDIDEYEFYCNTHENYENNKAVLAIENCKAVYRECVKKKLFLERMET